MKQAIGLCLLIFMSLNLIGCDNGYEGAKQYLDYAERQVDMVEGEEFVKKYFRLLDQGKYEETEVFYSKEFSKDDILENNKELKGMTLLMYDAMRLNDGVQYLFYLGKTARDMPLATKEVYAVTVVKEDGLLKIDDVEVTPDDNAFIEEDTIKRREYGSLEIYDVMSLNMIPHVIYKSTDKLRIEPIIIEEPEIETLSLSLDGEVLILVGACDEGKYVGIIDTKRHVAEGETLIGENIKVIDLFEDATINYAFRIADSMFVNVDYTMPDGTNRVKLYSQQSGKYVSEVIDREFPEEEYNVSNVVKLPGRNGIRFDVTSKESGESKEWTLSFRDFTIEEKREEDSLIK